MYRFMPEMNGVIAVTGEMKTNLMRTAYNMIIYEALDFTVGIFTKDGDTVSIAAVGVSTNGVTVTNGAGTLVYYNTNNVADLFTCTISDGWGGTNFQNVYIAIVSLPTNAVPAFTSVVNSNGTLQLDLAGMSGLTYVLQATTNLISPGGWLPLATNVPDTNGFWQFSDTITNNPQRFYRLKLVP